MRQIFKIIICCFGLMLQGQAESEFQIKDDLLNTGLFYNTKLSEHLSLQKGVFINKNENVNTLNLPVLLNLKVSDKWSLYFGSQINTIVNTDNQLLPIDPFNQSSIWLKLGIDYKFNDDVLGSFSIQYRIKQIDNNGIRTPVIQQPFKFNLGVKF